MARREITYYTCTPCEMRTGKEVKGERIVVDGVTYDLCVKDRKVVDQYLRFREAYGLAPRTVRTGRPRGKQTGSAKAPRRYQCGACTEAGETTVVAHNSRSWHAGYYHEGAKASEIDWDEVL